jgi:dihydrolipoamide dehydrogenase
MRQYDVVVIGGGPGGYIAAEHAAKHGAKVALVEKHQLGGTCLNSGCIPTKTFLRFAEVIESIQKAKKWGIETEKLNISYPKLKKRKDTIVKSLQKGVSSLLTHAEVDVYQGKGIPHRNHTVTITSFNKEVIIGAKKIILATGSRPEILNVEGLMDIRYQTYESIFELEHLPTSITIIGGGYMGVEFASILTSLKVKVHLVLLEDRLLLGEDEQVEDFLRKKLLLQKVKIHQAARLYRVMEENNDKLVHIETRSGDKVQVQTEEILILTGRKPNVEAFTELELKKNGPYLAVNKQMQTSYPNIYAIGDVIGTYQLAHAASAEGIVAASNAVNDYKEIDYHLIPRCIYTNPEVAMVGMTEKEAVAKGYKIRTEVYLLSSNGKAFVLDERTGFIKLIVGQSYKEILGAVIVGPNATEMISELSAFMLLEGTVEELANHLHPHPTVSEGIADAAKAWLEKAVRSEGIEGIYP